MWAKPGSLSAYGISGEGISETRIIAGPGIEIVYVVTDAAKWAVDTERDAIRVRFRILLKLMKKAWDEVAFVLQQ